MLRANQGLASIQDNIQTNLRATRGELDGYEIHYTDDDNEDAIMTTDAHLKAAIEAMNQRKDPKLRLLFSAPPGELPPVNTTTSAEQRNCHFGPWICVPWRSLSSVRWLICSCNSTRVPHKIGMPLLSKHFLQRGGSGSVPGAGKRWLFAKRLMIFTAIFAHD